MFSGISSKRVQPRRFVYFVRGTQEGISAYFLRQIERHANAKKVWPSRKQPSAFSTLRGPHPDADNNNIASCAVADVCCRLLQRALDGWRGAGVLSFPLHSLALPTSLLFRSARNVRQLHLEAIHCGQSTQRLCRRALVLNGVRWYLPAAGPAGFRCEGQLSQPIRLSMPTIPCNSALAAIPAD